MQLGTLELNVIHTGDARELSLQIPDSSVDLIFTDPIYDRIEDYIWLAQTAKRILKPQGAVLCWSNGKWHRENANWLECGGLKYRWDFGCITHKSNVPMNGKIIAKNNRLLWVDLTCTSKMHDYLPDGFFARVQNFGANTKHAFFKWTKDPLFTAKAIKAFSNEGSIIFDPFAGGGTVPAVCKMLNRNFLACEIEPETAEQARARLIQVMPLLEEQMQEELFNEGFAAA